jgi:long-chain fatty acid transport protein
VYLPSLYEFNGLRDEVWISWDRAQPLSGHSRQAARRSIAPGIARFSVIVRIVADTTPAPPETVVSLATFLPFELTGPQLGDDTSRKTVDLAGANPLPPTQLHGSPVMPLTPLTKSIVFASLLAVLATGHVQAQGIAVTGVGAVNRSMGGAGTAAPLDAIGAVHWNPGSISGLPTNEVSFGMELLLADIELNNNVGSSTSGEGGVAAIPSIGWVHHLEDSPMTIGLGIFGIGGFRNNQPTGNALLGGAPGFAEAEILQIAPTLSYAITDQLSIGVAPTITTTRLVVNPIGPPIAPLGPSQGNRMHWGGGFQAGVYYIADNGVHLGATFKSTQWMEDLRFFTPGAVPNFDLDYPMILSLGAAYTGIQDWTFAVDVRYFDYENTDGFREFGFSNVFAGAIGAQYRVNDRWHVRAGYNFNQNPISASDAFTNVLSPLIQEQNITGGVSYRFARCVDISLAYVYLIENELTGPAPVPGVTVSHQLSAHSALLGVTVRY